jgi:hypothetical protein
MAVDLKPYDYPQVIRSVFEVDDNCLRVKVINGSGGGGELEVLIDHTEDSIRLGDGTGFFTSTVTGPKRSLDVNITGGTVTDSTTQIDLYGEVTGVASGVLTTLLTYTATSEARLKKVAASGENIAEYQVLVNGNLKSKKRTYFAGGLNVDFTFDNGVELVNGDIVTVRCIHSRPDVADFNSNLIIEA